MEVTGGCKSSTCVLHGNIWGSGGIASVIRKISTMWEQEVEGIDDDGNNNNNNNSNNNNNNNNLFLMY